jgi:hypothetical protein
MFILIAMCFKLIRPALPRKHSPKYINIAQKLYFNFCNLHILLQAIGAVQRQIASYQPRKKGFCLQWWREASGDALWPGGSCVDGQLSHTQRQCLLIIVSICTEQHSVRPATATPWSGKAQIRAARRA